ncbi:trihelix transcription factor ASIL1 [Lolium rigidum]|uniref:trihelix transcription factor ASIL1 n=1 Tax=Lolium rigidum TaxID=89674 RepID=UPI001F5CFFA3|nr:trihelix transcription factor ASIL1 [Lolium rigidum]
MSSSSLNQDDAVSSPELPPLAAPGIAAAAAAAAAAASSGGGGLAIGSGRRLPPPCWTHEETLALIESYRDKWEALKKGNLRAADWDEVAGAVTARCGRFPTATYKSGVQCRHKIEKLRKRYRAERSRSAGRSKGPKWPFFALLHDLAGGAPDSGANPIIKIRPRGGTSTTPTPASPSSLLSSPTSSDEAGRSRSLHGLISNGGGGSGLRFTIPKGSRTRPGAPPPRDHLPTKPDTEEDPEAEAMAEVASALRAVGEGFLRMEERRLELSLQMEKDRMEAEMKRTQTMLDAQQLFVEAFLGKHQHSHHQHKRAKLVSSSAAAMDED